MRTSFPLTSTGANGLPLPTIARPSVQRSRSAGAASDCEVGFDSGKMTGCGVWRAISRTISSVNAPAWALTPASTVIPALRATSSNEIAPLLDAGDKFHPATSSRQRLLFGANSLPAFDDQAVAVEGKDALACLLFAQALLFHRGDEQINNANSRRSGAEHRDDLLAQWDPSCINPSEQCGCGYSRSSLNVVIEGAETVAV